MKVHHALDAVQEAELTLAGELRTVAERHAVEHDLYYLGHARAQVCVEHLNALRPFLDRYDATAVDPDNAEQPGVLATLRHKTAELLGRAEATGLPLLHDLRHLYLLAQRVEIDWVILLQTMEAVRDREFLALAAHCHEETEITAKWLRTRIKVSSAQVLATN